MRFFKYIYAAPILMIALCSLWSCDDGDDKRLSEAVLASANTLNFEGTDAVPQMITVYADAEWIMESPEWVTVSPTSGSGQTDVTVSVSNNLRDGLLDNPRKAAIIFKGRTLASQSEVLVLQAGDKYRDVKSYTPAEIAKLEDEAVVSVPNITVVAVTTIGYIASDEQNSANIYVLNDTEETVSVGDKISIMGSKYTDSQSLAYVESDVLEVVSQGGTVTYPEPTDITNQIDSYNPSSRDFIVVSGTLTGNNLAIADANYSVSITDAPKTLGLEALNGHRVTVKGYFAGVAAPVVRIMATELQDDGIAKTIYFSEDFEWLNPWSLTGEPGKGPVGKTVETDDLNAEAPQIVKVSVDGVSARDAIMERGYDLMRVNVKGPTTGECIYLQQNYLKFGKTGYQAGIVLPNLKEDIPSGVAPTLSFDWCPMRQGEKTDHKVDPVNLIVIVANGEQEVTFEIPTHGFENGRKLEWIPAKVSLTGVEITKNTKITIRQTEWGVSTANRWFLDNIEISSVAE